MLLPWLGLMATSDLPLAVACAADRQGDFGLALLCKATQLIATLQLLHCEEPGCCCVEEWLEAIVGDMTLSHIDTMNM